MKNQGGLYLQPTLNGPEIVVVNGQPQMDAGLFTSVYNALCGPVKPWILNEYQTPANKVHSRLQEFMQAQTMTSGNLRTAEAMATLDLQYLLDNGIADKVSVAISAVSRNRIAIAVDIWKDGSKLVGNEYQVNWAAMMEGAQ